MKKKLIGLFGGAFDPIHRGHLHVAKQLLDGLPFSTIRFMPCCQPPHRPPLIATPSQRLTMIEHALHDAGEEKFSVDSQEINRGGITYTIDTLNAIRAHDKTQAYALIMSSEAFSHFHTWRDSDIIPTLAHLVIVDRPGYVFSAERVTAERATKDPQALLKTPAGKLFYYPITNGLAISATAIREGLKKQKKSGPPVTAALTALTPSVADYIQRTRAYS